MRSWREHVLSYPNIDFSENCKGLFLKGNPSEYEKFKNKKLILFTTGRSGSTLFHHNIKEYFCPPYEIFNPIINTGGNKKITTIIKQYAKDMEIDTLDEEHVMSISITPWLYNGIYSIDSGFGDFFQKNSLCVFMYRKDIVSQAISYAIAKESGVWHIYKDDKNPISKRKIEKNIKDIYEYMDLIIYGEKVIIKLFDEIPKDSLFDYIQISYEDYICNPEFFSHFIANKISKSAIKNREFDKPVKNKPSKFRDNIKEFIMNNLPLRLPSGFKVTEEFLFSRYTS